MSRQIEESRHYSRVPHLRDGLIVDMVGIVRSTTALLTSPVCLMDQFPIGSLMLKKITLLRERVEAWSTMFGLSKSLWDC
jgi:hypothetical protein